MLRFGLYLLAVYFHFASSFQLDVDTAYLDYQNDIDPAVGNMSIGNISDVRYLVWTRSNSDDMDYYELEWLDADSLANSPLDGSKMTYFIIHGWGADGLTDWVLSIKNETLFYDDCNVISVDYGTLVPQPFYIESIDNIYLVADRTAVLIDWLIDQSSITLSNIHVGGHSLGAHTAGMTGAYITSGTLPRITGWDPAGPFFNNRTDDLRLSKEDALYVDVIHTNAGTIPEGCAGLFDPIGHVDFYPNGGQHQPGCTNPVVTDWMDLFMACSHHRAMEFWLESILGTNINETMVTFNSWPCESYEVFSDGSCPDCGQGCLDMGLHVDQSLGGSYYLNTNNDSPYAVGNQQ